jgi:RNA polymerase sigma-70 factor (ECF subfamily)
MKDRVAWLYRVGINRCKDYRRAMARAARLGQRLAGTLETVVASAVEDWSPEPRLIEILRPLPTRQRTAAALFYLAGFSTAEIAQTMGISEGTVGSHLHKAREALRKMLGEQ